MESVAVAMNGLMNFIGAFIAQTIMALAVPGQFLLGSLTILSIVFWGAASWGGVGGLVPMAIRITGVSAGTYWAVAYWDQLARGALEAARRATGLLIPGYAGPGGLFTLATDIVQRAVVEAGEQFSSWSPEAWAAALVNGLLAIIGWICLIMVGIQAFLAEIELLLGAAVAPLLLPFLAFGPTAGIGFATLTWIISAAIRVVVLGVVSALTAEGVTGALRVDGTDGTLTLAEILTVVALGMVSMVLAFNAASLASAIARGAPGALGWGAVGATTGAVAAGAAAMIGGAASAGGATLGGMARHGTAVWRGLRGTATAGTRTVGRQDSGSPFAGPGA